jgi:hypothetical protein
VLTGLHDDKLVKRDSILDNLTDLVGIAIVVSNCIEDKFGTIHDWVTFQENSRIKLSNHPFPNTSKSVYTVRLLFTSRLLHFS